MATSAAVNTVNQLLAQFRSLQDAKVLLDALENIEGNTLAAQEQLDATKDELAKQTDALTEAKAKVTDATSKADAIMDKARADANKLLSDAKSKVDLLVATTNASVDAAKNKVAELEAQADTALDDAATAKKELADLNGKLEAARAQRDKLLGA